MNQIFILTKMLHVCWLHNVTNINCRLMQKKNWVQFEPTEPNLLAGQSNPHEIVSRDYGETFCKL